MRKQRVAALSVVIVGVLFSLLTIAYGYSENEITVKASVYGAAWNEKGEVTGVSLLTTDGDELFVAHNTVGDELIKLVEQNIKASGAVLVDQQGRKNITVYKYEISYN
jgi:hypothetical protein